MGLVELTIPLGAFLNLLVISTVLVILIRIKRQVSRIEEGVNRIKQRVLPERTDELVLIHGIEYRPPKIHHPEDDEYQQLFSRLRSERQRELREMGQDQ